MFRLFLWLVFLLPQLLCGQLLYSLTDAPTLGRGGSGVAATGLSALWTNPAGIAVGQRLGYGATVVQRYGLGELTTVSGGVVYRGFGLQLATLGYGDYRASRFGMVYGRALSDRWRLGAELVILRHLVVGFGDRTRILPGVGVQYAAESKLILGLCVKNPAGSTGDLAIVGAGMSYYVSPTVALLTEAAVSPQRPLTARFGIAYSPVATVRLHLGYATDPGTIAVGASYRLAGDLRVAVAGSHHAQLGGVAAAGFYRNTLPPSW